MGPIRGTVPQNDPGHQPDGSGKSRTFFGHNREFSGRQGMGDNFERFSNKAEEYKIYRPSYPQALLAYLANDWGLGQKSIVADIGSGTGLFTALLLDRVRMVFGVEPNAEMRGAAEKRWTGNPHFVSVNGRAEETGLGAGTLDFITAAQAFHWFDPEKARKEFARILRKNGRVFLIWNKRSSSTDFMRAYDTFLHKNIPEFREKTYPHMGEKKIFSFLNEDPKSRQFPNSQLLDWQGLLGRFNSSSYAPPKGSGAHGVLVKKLKKIFDQYEKSGNISFLYETFVYSGKIQG